MSASPPPGLVSMVRRRASALIGLPAHSQMRLRAEEMRLRQAGEDQVSRRKEAKAARLRQHNLKVTQQRSEQQAQLARHHHASNTHHLPSPASDSKETSAVALHVPRRRSSLKRSLGAGARKLSSLLVMDIGLGRGIVGDRSSRGSEMRRTDGAPRRTSDGTRMSSTPHEQHDEQQEPRGSSTATTSHSRAPSQTGGPSQRLAESSVAC